MEPGAGFLFINTCLHGNDQPQPWIDQVIQDSLIELRGTSPWYRLNKKTTKHSFGSRKCSIKAEDKQQSFLHITDVKGYPAWNEDVILQCFYRRTAARLWRWEVCRAENGQAGMPEAD